MPDYKVSITVDKNADVRKERLVRAKNQSAALAHVVADTVTIDRATIDDVVRLTKAGVEVEQA
jgi:hypothetical protein